MLLDVLLQWSPPQIDGKLTLGENIADAGGLKESFLVSNTYHNTHTLSQGTPSLHLITSNHNTVSRKAPTQGRNISIPVRNSSTPGRKRERERGTDNCMEERKVGEREGDRENWLGRAAERRMEAGNIRGTERGRALMLERRS